MRPRGQPRLTSGPVGSTLCDMVYIGKDLQDPGRLRRDCFLTPFLMPAIRFRSKFLTVVPRGQSLQSVFPSPWESGINRVIPRPIRPRLRDGVLCFIILKNGVVTFILFLLPKTRRRLRLCRQWWAAWRRRAFLDG